MPTLTAVDAFACAACIALSYLFFFPNNRNNEHGNDCESRAYILETTVTHARLLPSPSSHKFTYPVLSFFFPLRATESHQISLLKGWLFSYGGISGRIVGLRANNYLYDDGGAEKSIRTKLGKVLRDFGVVKAGKREEVPEEEKGKGEEPRFDAWMMTMPAYCGFEGINPLTVYFCYHDDTPTKLWAVVLEIHNTFGERHIHVLEVGENEEKPDSGFDHQWTFNRDFHVSPFNDRLGTYTISVRPPSHSPSSLMTDSTLSRLYAHSAMKPAVRVHLHEPPLPIRNISSASTPESKGSLKLTALHFTRTASTLDSLALLYTLLRFPFALLLSFPRILKHAWTLHYRKGLGVWKRPEPVPVRQGWGVRRDRADVAAGQSDDEGRVKGERVSVKGGGVGWQISTMLESLAEREVQRFFEKRANVLGVEIELIPGNPNASVTTFSPSSRPPINPEGYFGKQSPHLEIWYLSPRLFPLLLLSSSSNEAIIAGGPSKTRAGDITEFVVNDEDLFTRVFECHPVPTGSSRPSSETRLLSDRITRKLRSHKPPPLPPSPLLELKLSTRLEMSKNDSGVSGGWICAFVIGLLMSAEWAEWCIWKAVGVRWAGIVRVEEASGDGSSTLDHVR